MKKEDQVVSVELSHEMKELDAEQDSVWYWIQQGKYIDDWSEAFLESKRERDARYDPARDGDCSAYTVAELGEMLKQHADTLPQWNKYNIGTKWFSDIYTPKGYCQVNEETEADARAKMWLFLRKEGLL